MISGTVNTDKSISEYIPQRPPFVFIDTIEALDAAVARTRYTVPAECVLVTDGVLPLSGLMENAAQTCAVRAGYAGGNKIGFIGAVKQMELTRCPRVGETLTTEARLVQEVLNISLVECTTRVNDEVIACATLKLAIID